MLVKELWTLVLQHSMTWHLTLPPVHPASDDDFSDEDNSLAEEGEVSSDNLEKQEQTEDMAFRETVRSVCSFMGWDYIPVFESDLSEPDKSNNPWRGKHRRKPARISVAMWTIGFAKS